MLKISLPLLPHIRLTHQFPLAVYRLLQFRPLSSEQSRANHHFDCRSNSLDRHCLSRGQAVQEVNFSLV